MVPDPIVTLDIHPDDDGYVACDPNVHIGRGDTPGEAVDNYWQRYGKLIEEGEVTIR